MSELQFPKNPIVGQQYDFPPYRYYWDGIKWKTKGIGYNPVNDLRDELEPRIKTSENKIEDLSAQYFEALRRSYAEAGLTLVDGSFEEGATVNLKTEVVWQQATGKVFAWFQDAVKTVVAGSTPETSGGVGSGAWVDRTDVTLRLDLASESGSELVGYQPAGAGAVATDVQSKLRALEISDSDFPTLQKAIDVLQSGQTLNIGKTHTLSAGLNIINKSRIRITGNGSIMLSGATSSTYIFNLVGTIDCLEIDSLTLIGEGNSGYSQGAIGCASGQTISNTRFHDLKIRDINVGISHNANLGGSWTTAYTYNNSLENILGTVPGSGYGLHFARCYDFHCYGNTINNASRHGVYVAKGYGLNGVVENNIFRNHRSTVYDANPRAACEITRCSGVTVANNKFIDCYDCQVYVGHDSAGGYDCYDISVIGNTFSGRKNVVPALYIGEQLAPVVNSTYRISVRDNTFNEDVSVGGVSVNLLNGTQIAVENNTFNIYNVTTALPPRISIGDDSFLSSDSHIEKISVRGNYATSNASVSGAYFVWISSRLCTGTSAYIVKNNEYVGWSTEFYFSSIPTNPNSKLKFKEARTIDVPSIPAQGAFAGVYAVNGAKPTSVVTARPQYSLSYPMGFQAFASDTGLNTVGVAIQNSTSEARDWPSQTIIFSVEDF